jgi:hypothetical protein
MATPTVLHTGTTGTYDSRNVVVVVSNEPFAGWTTEVSETVIIQFVPSRRGFPKTDCIAVYANHVTVTA